MEINIALQILDIKKPYNKEKLKKAYYKKCLQYHPDKNPRGEQMFKLCVEANEILEKELHVSKTDIRSDCNMSYTEMFTEYMGSFMEKYNITNKDIYNATMKIVQSCSNVSIDIFKEFDNSTKQAIYELLIRWKQIFHIDDEILREMSKIIEESNQPKNTYLIQPTIKDLFDHNIYKLMVEDKPLYIPMWHNEVYFNDNIVVHIQPEIPNDSHITHIDEDNNIYVIQRFVIQNILYANTIYVKVGEKTLEIPVKDLHIVPIQEFIFPKEGIPRINTKDTFDDSEMSDIIVHIILSTGHEKSN